MKIVLLGILSLCSIAGFSAAPEWEFEWVRHLPAGVPYFAPTSLGPQFSLLRVAGDGTVFVAGTNATPEFCITGPTNSVCLTGASNFLACFDRTGNLLWAKALAQFPFSLKIWGANGCLIADNGLQVTRFSREGTADVLFTASIGTNSLWQRNQLQGVPIGTNAFYVWGTYKETISLMTSKTQATVRAEVPWDTETHHVYCAKVTVGGEIQWLTNSMTTTTHLIDLATVSSNEFIIAHKSTNRYRDLVLERRRGDGSVVWTNSGVGTRMDSPYAMTADDQNVLVADNLRNGTLTQFDSNTVDNRGDPYEFGEALFLSFDPGSGRSRFARLIGGPSSELLEAVTTSHSGNFYALGYYGYIGNDSFAITGSSNVLTLPRTTPVPNKTTSSADLFFIEYDEAGEPVTSLTLGDGGMQIGTGVGTDDEDGVYVLGRFNGNIELLDKAISGPPANDYAPTDFFVAKIRKTQKLIMLGRDGDIVRMSAQGPMAQLFVVERSADFKTWTAITTNVYAGRRVLLEDDWQESNVFYRLRENPVGP